MQVNTALIERGFFTIGGFSHSERDAEARLVGMRLRMEALFGARARALPHPVAKIREVAERFPGRGSGMADKRAETHSTRE